ncbi:O-antigen ligase family protein [Humitalea sp. 24SJ18S-53]|uniref:O-antigen ligase family protein n=1 Tax=Humitalea sp. 24SJ18S-53 TaxID=3422307 RepID=UPI003D668A2D
MTDRPPLPAWRCAAFPLAVGLAIAPPVAVLQSKAMAPLALVTLALVVVAHLRAGRGLPWPKAPLAWLVLALGGFGMLSAAWAVLPGYALQAGAGVAGLGLLGGAAARAIAADTPEHRAMVGRGVFWGVLVGLVVALTDAATGNALRAVVRLGYVPRDLATGLKPAASVLALLLPLAVMVPTRLWARCAVAVAGIGGVMLLPGDTARLSAVAGVASLTIALAVPRLVRPAMAGFLALLLLAGPVALGVVLARGVPADRLPVSAAHRFLIWDFADARIAERPMLGWGLESSRQMPGGKGQASAEALTRFGLTSPQHREWFANPAAEMMPLHPHNLALQVRLELGWPGAVLAAGVAVAAAMGACVAGLGVLAAASVSALLSFGAWQMWWLGSMALAAVAAGAIQPRRTT